MQCSHTPWSRLFINMLVSTCRLWSTHDRDKPNTYMYLHECMQYSTSSYFYDTTKHIDSLVHWVLCDNLVGSSIFTSQYLASVNYKINLWIFTFLLLVQPSILSQWGSDMSIAKPKKNVGMYILTCKDIPYTVSINVNDATCSCLIFSLSPHAQF